MRNQVKYACYFKKNVYNKSAVKLRVIEAVGKPERRRVVRWSWCC